MSLDSIGFVRFEGYEIDRARWQLRHGENLLPLNRKTFDLLLYLVDHADRVVTKDELLRALWPEQFIEESNLTQQIFLLRKVLARHESGARIIETTPGRGYRFAVPVHAEPRPGSQRRLEPQPADGGSDPGGRVRGGGQETMAAAAAPRLPHDPHAAGQAVATPAPIVGTRSRVRWLLWMAATVTAMLAVWYLGVQRKQPGHVSIATYTQITHDGHAKSLGGTDGSRIYFTRLEASGIAQLSIAGGAEAPLPLAIQDPWSGDVSPDGSTLLIISQAGGQGPAASLWTLQLVGGALHRLGNAISSAWSPDGQKIVYASADGDLAVMRSDGSDARRIASVGGDVKSIAWSPDGHTIRFSKDGLLWQISPDGSALGQLLPGWGRSPTQWSGQWAPNGAYFFVADGQIWMLSDGGGLAGKRTSVPIQLTYGPTVWDRPVSSPDGKKLLASGRTSRGELVRFDPASRQLKTFLAGISAEFVTFSPAVHSVAYVTYPEGVLVRANADGGNPVRLTEPPFYPKSICWSPDGSQIAFVDRTADNVAAVYVVPSSGTGKPHRLFPGDTEAENDPSWSPTGQQLVYATSPNVGASARSDLRIFDLATKKATAVPGSEGLLVPHWSPDGHAITAMTLDTKSLRLLNLSSGSWTSLETGAVAFPEWSHDGKWIYYVRWTADPAILRIRVADGKREALTDLRGARYTGSYTLWMGLDATDNPMMLRDAGSDDIYALTLQRD